MSHREASRFKAPGRHRGTTPDRRLLSALVLAVACPIAAAAEELPRDDMPSRPAIDLEVGSADTPRRFETLIGLSATSAAEYLGADRRDIAVRPMLALRYGRLRISTGGSGALLDTATDEDGATLDLMRSAGWSIRSGLRLSSGRRTSDSEALEGLPDVRRTALGRIAVTRALAPRWQFASTLSIDLLGRGSGAVWTNGVDYRRALGGSLELRAGAGLSVADARHLRSYYGVPADAATPARPAYLPGAGAKDASIGLTLTRRLDPAWVAFGGLRYTRLLGDAADSPLAHRRDDVAVSLGVAWIWCR